MLNSIATEENSIGLAIKVHSSLIRILTTESLVKKRFSKNWHTVDSLTLENTDPLFLHTTTLPEANMCSPLPAHVRIRQVA